MYDCEMMSTKAGSVFISKYWFNECSGLFLMMEQTYRFETGKPRLFNGFQFQKKTEKRYYNNKHRWDERVRSANKM